MAKMLDQLRAQLPEGAPNSPIGRLIGWKLVEVEAGQAVFELAGEARHANSRGAVHGGVLCSIAQVAMATAYGSTLDEGESVTTVDLKINFLRPAPQGRLVARGRLVHRGRTLGLAECDVTDADARLVARASSTCLTLRSKPAALR